MTDTLNEAAALLLCGATVGHIEWQGLNLVLVK